jgi:hypothetical protein
MITNLKTKFREEEYNITEEKFIAICPYKTNKLVIEKFLIVFIQVDCPYHVPLEIYSPKNQAPTLL